ncbi:hypothetical protein OWV82_011830 [Melia azedarach]|uniref:Uncharacterized protein n=1 Tax=Melia azedarach TaxID=155640 RepID=A0ACC1Y0Y7_MELAZ|nr:hypothetical protein OWV82_011830 [Melia azedarach]
MVIDTYFFINLFTYCEIFTLRGIYHRTKGKFLYILKVKQFYYQAKMSFPYINELEDFEVDEAYWSYNNVEEGVESENIENNVGSTGWY